MKEWKDILVELAKKLTPPLAFGVLFVFVLSQFGDSIPSEYINLVYDLGVGALGVWVVFEIFQIWRSRGAAPKVGNQSVLSTGKNSQITYIVNHYAHNTPGIPKEDLEKQLGEYLDWVQESFGTIVLRGISQGSDSAVILPLETVYVPLAAEFSSSQEELEENTLEKHSPSVLERTAQKDRQSTRIDLIKFCPFLHA